MKTWLPPDQVATRKFPIVGERAPATQTDGWQIEVLGAVERPRSIELAAFIEGAQAELSMDVHCVTRWSHRGAQFTGRPLAQLLDGFGIAPEAAFVRFVAHSDRDHDTSLPLDYALAHCWVVHAMNGAPLTTAHGGPIRVVTPGRYFYKSLKWLRTIELLERDRLGFWEREDGYHNRADPWGNQRYLSGSLTAEQLERFKAATRFGRWRKRTIGGANLAGWAPTNRALGALSLKGCNLRGAQLGGVDLRGCNLSLSDLRGADLREADLSGGDLEGADLRGADLRGADLTCCALTATQLVGAQLEGARFTDAWGLLEADAAYLRGVQ